MSEKYYVAGCVDNGLDVVQVEDQDAEFWTLYARDVNGESEWLADFADRRSAEAAMAVYVERDVLGEQVRALAEANEEAKSAIAKLLEDARRIQVIEPNAGTETRVRDAVKCLVSGEAVHE